MLGIVEKKFRVFLRLHDASREWMFRAFVIVPEQHGSIFDINQPTILKELPHGKVD